MTPPEQNKGTYSSKSGFWGASDILVTSPDYHVVAVITSDTNHY
jgi:hypothetical protein